MTLLDSTLVGEAYSLPRPRGGDRVSLLILGVGNVLMGDEGVGVHVLRALESGVYPAGVRLLDGGTAGIELLGDIQRARAIVMIDATRDGRPAGTVTRLRPKSAAALPRGLSAHDFGIKDLFAAATLLEAMPVVHLFAISVETINPMCLELSPQVAASVSEVVKAVRLLVGEFEAACQFSGL